MASCRSKKSPRILGVLIVTCGLWWAQASSAAPPGWKVTLARATKVRRGWVGGERAVVVRSLAAGTKRAGAIDCAAGSPLFPKAPGASQLVRWFVCEPDPVAAAIKASGKAWLVDVHSVNTREDDFELTYGKARALQVGVTQRRGRLSWLEAELGGQAWGVRARWNVAAGSGVVPAQLTLFRAGLAWAQIVLPAAGS